MTAMPLIALLVAAAAFPLLTMFTATVLFPVLMVTGLLFLAMKHGLGRLMGVNEAPPAARPARRTEPTFTRLQGDDYGQHD
jgi:hypothetical protein